MSGPAVGIRPLREDGSIELDTTMIAAAIQASGRTKFRYVVRRPDHVALEVLEREETGSHWQARCSKCGRTSAPTVERPDPSTCCDRDLRVTRIPAGWAFVGDADWSLERARAAKLLPPDKPDVKGVWTNFPTSCLFGLAVREAWKSYAPDALPVGVRVFYPDHSDAPDLSGPALPQRQENAAHQGPPLIESRMVRASTTDSRDSWEPWTALVSSPKDAARAALAGRQPPKTGPKGGKGPLFVEVWLSGHEEDRIDVYRVDHDRNGWDEVKLVDHRRGKPETTESVYGRLRVLAGGSTNAKALETLLARRDKARADLLAVAARCAECDEPMDPEGDRCPSASCPTHDAEDVEPVDQVEQVEAALVEADAKLAADGGRCPDCRDLVDPVPASGARFPCPKCDTTLVVGNDARGERFLAVAALVVDAVMEHVPTGRRLTVLGISGRCVSVRDGGKPELEAVDAVDLRADQEPSTTEPPTGADDAWGSDSPQAKAREEELARQARAAAPTPAEKRKRHVYRGTQACRNCGAAKGAEAPCPGKGATT